MIHLLRSRVPALLALAASSLVLPACLGGGSSPGAGAGTSFGIEVCSLGCKGNSFTITSWQVDKDLTFTFTDEVDPTSVDFSSFNIVEVSTGATPVGNFVVRGRQVIFRPALIETATGLSFGFQDGATYRIVIPATGVNRIRSKGGEPNTTGLQGTLLMAGVADLVPGPPVVLEVTPNADEPPTTASFPIRIVFGDIMRTFQLADPETGQSALITISIADSEAGTNSVVPGTFTATIDRDSLLTTVEFVPSVQMPGSNGGARQLQVNLSQQITDLVGNPLVGAGVIVIPLPDFPESTGTLVEAFDDAAQVDEAYSVMPLWPAPLGFLDSGLDPLTGLHFGGGPGVLGDLEVTSGITTLNTDGHVVSSDFLGEDVTVLGGVFPFARVHVAPNAKLTATGSNPLRLLVQGEVSIEGSLDLDGQSAPPNYGKFFPPQETFVGESTVNSFDETNPTKVAEIAGGGQPGIGDLTAGSGGVGGISWYAAADGMGNSGLGDAPYYDHFLCSWQDHLGGICTANPSRFEDDRLGDEYCGANGEGVGGVAPQGSPTTSDAQFMDEDLAAGSGMGTWTWPPRSNVMTDANLSNGVRIESHLVAPGGVPTDRLPHALHRARGGGGGGYWTPGGTGVAYTDTDTDPLGNPLVEPNVVPAQGVYEMNDDGAGGDFIPWNARDLAATVTVRDGEGGDYVLPAGAETLDPELGFLVGGAGGGGAGGSQHGSLTDAPDVVNGAIDSFRCGDGAGGGAGGGAGQIQAGSRLAVAGTLSANGGDGGDSEFMLSVPWPDSAAITVGLPGDAGGGGGSGGALLLQIAGDLQVAPDAIQVMGGEGGLGSAGNRGGDGGSGVVRFESPTPPTLADLQAMVAPDEAVDLAPVGAPGMPNSAPLQVQWTGTTGDVTASDGTVFDANSSAVRSLWYEAPANVNQFVLTDWVVTCEYLDAGGVQTVVYDSSSPTDPGVTPIWVAFETAWMEPGQSQQADPAIVLSSGWVIPGFGSVTNGLQELGSILSRAVRFQIVFDQDQIDALIGGTAGGYFRVDEIRFEWQGS